MKDLTNKFVQIEQQIKELNTLIMNNILQHQEQITQLVSVENLDHTQKIENLHIQLKEFIIQCYQSPSTTGDYEYSNLSHAILFDIQCRPPIKISYNQHILIKKFHTLINDAMEQHKVQITQLTSALNSQRKQEMNALKKQLENLFTQQQIIVDKKNQLILEYSSNQQ